MLKTVIGIKINLLLYD